MKLDPDLQSIQEMRDAVNRAHAAQAELKNFTQEEIDRIVAAMAEAGEQAAEELARLAFEETGMGNVADKTVKNLLATRDLRRHIAPMKTAGVIRTDPERKVVEIAEPMGVIAGVTPVTNPTSTAMYKSIISLKSRNTIVLSPHPHATRCTIRAAQIMEEAAVKAGAPEGVVTWLEHPSIQAAGELMRHPKIAMILATGGTSMVKAAYSSGTPALGVGPGNVPAFVERTADVPKAVADIVLGKTFDNGTICASEQAVIADEPIAEQVKAELQKNGGYFLSPAEIDLLSATVIRPNGGVNPLVVGRSAIRIAEMAGFSVPASTRLLIAPLEGVGPDYPLSREKLSPVLAYYTAPDWKAACERCLELLAFGGVGHSMVIHSRDEQVIMAFAMHKPVFRILANTPGALGGVGATTGLAPALTLGCGTWGGSATSDNVGPLNLLNIKRLAYGIREVARPQKESTTAASVPLDQLDRILRAVLEQLNES